MVYKIGNIKYDIYFYDDNLVITASNIVSKNKYKYKLSVFDLDGYTIFKSLDIVHNAIINCFNSNDVKKTTYGTIIITGFVGEIHLKMKIYESTPMIRLIIMNGAPNVPNVPCESINMVLINKKLNGYVKLVDKLQKILELNDDYYDYSSHKLQLVREIVYDETGVEPKKNITDALNNKVFALEKEFNNMVSIIGELIGKN